MVTFIEILEGNHQGSRFKVEQGLTLGRLKADILIKDPKVSGTHARVELDGKGQFVLIDLNSSNGLYLNSRRVKKVALIPGVTFEVGRTKFSVVQISDEQAASFSRVMTWRSILHEVLPSKEAQNRQVTLQSFNPSLRLSFTQGIQADYEIVLGYGPRQAGSQSLDIELLDEEAPQDAFELVPTPAGTEIKIKAQGRVMLNNVSKSSEILKDGDLISFGATVIKVSYL